MATRSIVPRADSEGGIGTAAKKWALGWINALVVTTLNALTLTAQAVGFTATGGTTPKTLTVTADTSLDEAVAMSSKAPKTATIAGDGTAGRVLRCINISLDYVSANHLNCTSVNIWNGDALATEDRTVGQDTTNWNWINTGVWIIFKNAAISGDCVGIVGYVLYNNTTGIDVTPQVTKVATGIEIVMRAAVTGVAQDLSILINGAADAIGVNITYITSA